jgi:N-acetylmuramoyl-L-alanine amidase
MNLIRQPSPNHEPRRGDVIDMLVLHYTGMQSAQAALDRLCDSQAKVSAHYLIDEDGTIHALVPESQRAWHAGLSYWRGETDINSRSIGIELVNPGHEFGYRAFPEDQIAALIRLCAGILSRHSIPPWNVIGHSDVAPARKQDPGELFPWQRLKGHGIGLWPFDDIGLGPCDDIGLRPCDGIGLRPCDGPETQAIGDDKLIAMLGRYGYDTADPGAAIAAFQRHFRPSKVDGLGDAETAGRLARLLGGLPLGM